MQMGIGASVTVRLDLKPVQQILAEHKMGYDKQAQRFLASEVKRQCDPYVPMRTGVLKNTAQVQRDGVLYVQPYAALQYYKNGGRGNEGTSLGGRRGRMWDKRMIADHGQDLINAVAKYVGGSAK